MGISRKKTFALFLSFLFLSLFCLEEGIDAEKERIRFMAYGDSGKLPDVHREILSYCLEDTSELDFVIHLGDMTKDGDSDLEWKRHMEMISAYDFEFHHIPGNHEYSSSERPFPEYLKYLDTEEDRTYYTFSLEDTRFFFLDSMDLFFDGTKQMQWFRSELLESREGNVLIFLHVPFYSIGKHAESEISKKQRELILPLLAMRKEKKYTVISGHDHLFYHTKRNGIEYLVSGGGGSPLYNSSFSENLEKGVAIEGDLYASFHHCLIFTIEGEDMYFEIKSPYWGVFQGEEHNTEGYEGKKIRLHTASQ
jgi:predicted phosphodiesterase